MVHARPLTAATGRPPAIDALLILGPTASGKSALAMALAERLPVEIVSVDSAQVYRGLDIGTAKPDAADQARVPHHLIDIREPEEAYNAARFVADANRLIGEIRGRGRLPLLVGGTMLYARALLLPFDDLPSADPAIRARLEGEAARLGWPALHARLAERDPVTAARLVPTDAQRIQRALEVLELTGEPLSRLQRGAAPSAAGPDPRRPVLALEPSDRGALHRRIADRFDAMLAAGLVDEVRRLRGRPALTAATPSMRSVGYRQAWAMLDGELPAGALREAGIAATRQLAKRQLTWLRSLPAQARLDCLAPDLIGKASAIIDSLVDPPRRPTGKPLMNPSASSPAPTLLMIGLGRMGANMARRLALHGAVVHGHDPSADARAALEATAGDYPVTLHPALDAAIAALPRPRVVWLMLPAGAVTERTIDGLTEQLGKGDLIIDGGNANYVDSRRRAERLAGHGIEFVDCGVSGGVWGLANGYSVMYGASPAAAAAVEPIMRRLAPSEQDGWLHCGPVGSGHFVKMVHNGIEYGMMQAIAEGFALMEAKKEFELPLADIGELWRHGSVVRSWLLDLTAEALRDPNALDSVGPVVADSGEGRWTIEESMRLGVPVPVIAMAMMSRFDSQGKADVGNKLLALMRKGFGGHAVVKAGR